MIEPFIIPQSSVYSVTVYQSVKQLIAWQNTPLFQTKVCQAKHDKIFVLLCKRHFILQWINVLVFGKLGFVNKEDNVCHKWIT